ncbi:MAG: lysoplasmalogenase [Cytophagales bacterium]|nr:MAG: lysoplasmalogenase [Cytophagales bacterium]
MSRFWIFFIIICLGDIVGRLLNNFYIDVVFKPLLMPTLMGYVYLQTAPHFGKFPRLLLVSLFFSWWGDIFLLFDSPPFFMLGLGCFLLAHIFYIILFQRISTTAEQSAWLKANYWAVTPFLLYIIVFYSQMYPKLNVMALPVLVYSITIALMALMALYLYKTINNWAFQRIFFGALLFVISDSFIGFNRFIYTFESASVLIMLTYIAGQTLITIGVVSLQQKNL